MMLPRPASASKFAAVLHTARSAQQSRVLLCSTSSAAHRVSSLFFQFRSMSSSLPTVSPPLTAALPSESFHLLPDQKKPGAAEDALYEQQIKDVEAWWAGSRYAGIKRPYTAADVVSKRGSLQQSYPSSLMARKLWSLVQDRLAQGEPLHTSMQWTSPNSLPLPPLSQKKQQKLVHADRLPLSLTSGCHRPCPNDSTSPPPRSPLPVRLGLLRHPHSDQRSLPRLRRLPL